MSDQHSICAVLAKELFRQGGVGCAGAAAGRCGGKAGQEGGGVVGRAWVVEAVGEKASLHKKVVAMVVVLDNG